MDTSRFSIAKKTFLAVLVVLMGAQASSVADDSFRCAVEGCTMTDRHTHGGQSSASGAVNEYEAFRSWRDRTGRKDATYQDYLDWKTSRGGLDRKASRGTRDVGRGHEPRQPASAPPDLRDRPVKAQRPHRSQRPRRLDSGSTMTQRRSRQPLRTGPLHEDCRAHLNGYARFTEFPCIIERACKKCPTTVLMHASSYSFDKYDRLNKIKYRRTICPNCRYENKLTIRFGG